MQVMCVCACSLICCILLYKILTDPTLSHDIVYIASYWIIDEIASYMEGIHLLCMTLNIFILVQ